MNTIQSNTISPALLNAMNPGKTQAGTIDAAQDRFMTLLVTQMKNQDPLNPMDNAQMTSQLAQLSTVTGIEKLNTTMQSMISSVQSSQAFQATNMLGRDVMVPGNLVQLSAGTGRFGVDLPFDVDKLNISIQDSNGNIVRDITLGPQSAGLLSLNWDGYSDAGSSMQEGKYRISVTAKAGRSAATANPLSLDQVSGVINNGQGVSIQLKTLGQVGINDIKQIQN